MIIKNVIICNKFKKKYYIYRTLTRFFYIYTINLKLTIMTTILIIWAATLVTVLMLTALLGKSSNKMKQNFNEGFDKEFSPKKRQSYTIYNN